MNYYCSNCKITFEDDDSNKAHYKTDFHRYNIKRKLINLEPVTNEVFQTKFADAKQKIVPQKEVLYQCDTCKYNGKSFSSKSTYQQHLVSKKHKDQLKKELVQVEPSEKKKSSETSFQNVNRCLFCDLDNDSLDSCVKHMKIKHGFVIREEACLINLKGLLHSLSEQINVNLMCLHCFQNFSSKEANKQHMLDKGHCFMPQQEYKLLSEYYDFSGKLQKLIDENKQLFSSAIEAGKQKDKEEEQEVIVVDDEDGDGEDWESDEDEQQQQHQQQIDRKALLKQQLNELKKFKAKLTRNDELLLPNGRILGHRMYKRYYRQNHIPLPIPEPRNKMVQQARETETGLVALDDYILNEYVQKYYTQFKWRYQDRMLRLQLLWGN